MTNVLFCQTRLRNEKLPKGNKQAAKNTKEKKARKIGKYRSEMPVLRITVFTVLSTNQSSTWLTALAA